MTILPFIAKKKMDAIPPLIKHRFW